MMRYLSVPILVFLFISCRQPVHEHLHDKNDEQQMKYLALKFPVPISENLDSTDLFFAYEKVWDTSYYVYIKKKNNQANIFVNYAIAPYYSAAADMSDSLNRVRFYESLIFAVDTLTWNVISHKADSILSADAKTDKEYGVFDGPNYFLSHGYNLMWNRGMVNEQLLEGFRDYLRQEIIYKRLNKRPK
ncbi:hypothetical protein ACE38W_07220 [Chitinophaga sp. Hz27]|uniref:hypothetical protein n=1 Tax=Chitinophaga sp. Hz27 TaxID=3347169 RepID=UPI0035D7A667